MTNLDCLPRLQAPPSTAQQWSPNCFVPCVKTSLISPLRPSHLPYAKAQQPNHKNHKTHSQCCMSPPEQVMATCSQSPPEANLSIAIKVHSESDPVPHDKMDLKPRHLEQTVIFQH